ncbi:putative 2OG-Fe(II) oxygenase [Paraglaciecola sp. 2405UD69-4]|uniref:putative 2OG-Fe(II) oxygenase n=1 Tax=Paraglaciecola sp. 2405UD69-4 TaxID=3391836 RepID=UPI0039C900CD
MPHSNLQQQLNQIYTFIKQNKLSQAEALLKPLKAQYPSLYQIWFLSGVVGKQQLRFESAVKDFKQAIYYNKNDWQLYNHLAICLKRLSKPIEAEGYYKTAFSLAGQFKHEPFKNLLILYIDNKSYVKALHLVEENHKIVEAFPVLQKLVADIYRLQGKLETAILLYEKVLLKQPNNTNAHQNLGLCWQKNGKVSQAIKHFEIANKLEPNNYQSLSSLGDSYVSLGEPLRAEMYYLNALELAPQQREIHDNLNELYWQLGNLQQFGKSYEKVLDLFPNDELRSAFVDLLSSAAQYERAQLVLEKASDHNSKSILKSKAYLLAKFDQLQLSISTAEQALLLGFDLGLALHKVQLEMSLNKLSEAQLSLDRVFEVSPHNQLALALQGTLWRLVGDARYKWLNDYDNFVRVYTLPVPKGFASLDEFLEKLKERLMTLHKFNTAPLRQTLINGSQIPGGLFSKQYPEIDLLVKGIRELLETYIHSLPDGPEHPLLSRKAEGYEFSGSWSVKLDSQGYHVSHVHSDGWISSSFYVHVPEGLSGSEGDIYFGKSSLNLNTNDDIELTVKPTPGMLVLFPSYFWHGTFPFKLAQKDAFRLTSPFDVVPKGTKGICV